MERYEVPEERLPSDMIAAAGRGDEVVVTRGGEVVATVIPVKAAPARGGKRGSLDMDALIALRKRLTLMDGDGAALIRELRDADDC